MYEPKLGLAMSHFAVSRAIMELSTRPTLSCTDIAQYIGASEPTVRRCLKDMRKAKIVVREGNPRKGYRYICVQPDYNWSSLR